MFLPKLGLATATRVAADGIYARCRGAKRCKREVRVLEKLGLTVRQCSDGASGTRCQILNAISFLIRCQLGRNWLLLCSHRISASTASGQFRSASGCSSSSMSVKPLRRAPIVARGWVRNMLFFLEMKIRFRRMSRALWPLVAASSTRCDQW